MITGEAATGTDWLRGAFAANSASAARALSSHQHGGRFRAKLIESELFRHNRRLYRRHAPIWGRFAHCEWRSLFSTRSATCPPEAQTRCCGAARGGIYRRWGGPVPIRSNVRNHRGPPTATWSQLIRRGNSATIFLIASMSPRPAPAVAQRARPIVCLVRIRGGGGARRGLPSRCSTRGGHVSPAAAIVWPGTLRELENLVRPACALYSHRSSASMYRRRASRIPSAGS